LVIPYGVRKTAPRAFMNCGKITMLVIIEDDFTEFGEEAFRGCVNVKSVNITGEIQIPLPGSNPSSR
ncbi:MAG: leucine-rich repeat domain-containing protein, partial [Synergistaceae bacterium]|nr:leucine-rich repeat domain-containing protein [Synergistaceae bacterium]